MKSLKLNKIESNKIRNADMEKIRGGEVWVCTCGCQYANNGGSSVVSNRSANASGRKIVPIGVKEVAWEAVVTP